MQIKGCLQKCCVKYLFFCWLFSCSLLEVSDNYLNHLKRSIAYISFRTALAQIRTTPRNSCKIKYEERFMCRLLPEPKCGIPYSFTGTCISGCLCAYGFARNAKGMCVRYELTCIQQKMVNGYPNCIKYKHIC